MYDYSVVIIAFLFIISLIFLAWFNKQKQPKTVKKQPPNSNMKKEEVSPSTPATPPKITVSLKLKHTSLPFFSTADAYYNLGVAYFSLDNYQEAIGAFKEAIKLKPKNPDSYFNLGMIYKKIGLSQEVVLDTYKKAIRMKIDPSKTNLLLFDRDEAYYNLGTAFFNLGRYKEAVTAFKELIELEPDNADAYFNIGVLYDKMNLAPEAVIEAYQAALSLNPHYTEAYFNMGVMHMRRGNVESALKQQRILKTLDPKLASDLLSAFYS